MASSSAGQPGQQRRRRPPPTFEASASTANGAQADTFASYLEQRSANPQHIPPVVVRLKPLKPAWCAHCNRKRLEEAEDLGAIVSAMPPNRNNGGEHTVSWSHADAAPRELALEGRSCSRCAVEIYGKARRHLRDGSPAAGSGGNTPLHQAARSGNLRMLFHLVTLLGLDAGHGRVAEALRRTNERQETALHMAVCVGDKDMVRLLLWVDPRLGQIACRCHDTSLIYLAVSQGDENIAQQLYDASGPDANLVSSYSGPSGQNALHAAVLHGEGMTRMVLAWKKDLSTKKDQNGSTPLHFAVSVEQRTYIPRWCFRLAWLRNAPVSFQKRMVNVPAWPLLDAQPSMAYQPDNEGLFPVHVAAVTNQTAAVHVLLTECPGCVGVRDGRGRTFLHAAVQHEGSSVVRYACRRPECASIMNVQDEDGNTALHLAVAAEKLRMLCNLLTNRGVCLNLRNNKGQTALDLAMANIRKGFFYGRNRDKLIYSTLARVGAKHSSRRGDKLSGKQDSGAEAAEQAGAGELHREESAKLTDASRTLAVGSVLIATMTFGATFTRLPGDWRPGDPGGGGAPAIAGRWWFFDAFVVASALAFILSSSATVGLMYSGIAMVELPIRRKHFLVSLFLVSSSVTCLTIAFALGVYMVLAPVARGTAIAVCVVSPLLLIYRNAESLQKLFAVSGPLYARMGFWVCLRWSGGAILLRLLKKFWPFVVIFGLAGHLRNHHHQQQPRG
ncbi:hypothetical protein GQ55_1G301800 [Panicum hallii var. hallii]|uniref:PGG domain-containing protein n=1 Tax=Panicum hallii var. hallii TaxID=1504633 RepID=A0A2T7F917_9POAL|nr:hypothetical protein GQ55_1G301800 [Panicum hallii var. hallii]PUZ76575.1 hypothetical protein GQ55_1G301800 [Panicum hallii var. hallii]